MYLFMRPIYEQNAIAKYENVFKSSCKVKTRRINMYIIKRLNSQTRRKKHLTSWLWKEYIFVVGIAKTRRIAEENSFLWQIVLSCSFWWVENVFSLATHRIASQRIGRIRVISEVTGAILPTLEIHVRC